MKLYIPIWYGDRIFTECEIKKPTPGIIADTSRLVEEGKVGMALLVFVSNAITKLVDKKGNEEINNEKIRTICREMKQRCIEDVAIDILLNLDECDSVEGVYECPRCGKQIICEVKDGFDTTDKISELSIEYYEEEEDYFEKDFVNPFEIKVKGEVTETIRTVGFRHPTITDFIQCTARVGMKNYIKLQYALYNECLVKVNGVEIDKTWKNRWGMYMFENLTDIKKDLNPIAKEFNKYGRDRHVKKACQACGKEWEALINTSNFFVLGLRQE